MAVFEPSEVVQAYGPNVTRYIPAAPENARLKTETGVPVYLTRLTCQHIGMVSPSTVAAEEKARMKAMLDAPETVSRSQALLDELLAEVRAGKKVDPLDVAAAQQTIDLERIAEAGRQERAAAEKAAAEEAARKALEGPLHQRMAESRQRLQAHASTAYEALAALADAVEADMCVHDEVVTELTAAGYTADQVRATPNGYYQATIVAGEAFQFWPPQEWIIQVLNHLQYDGKHAASFHGIAGRDLSHDLPSPIPKGPRLELDE
jgi:Skp family chaperone for outer membrane proteins